VGDETNESKMLNLRILFYGKKLTGLGGSGLLVQIVFASMIQGAVIQLIFHVIP
jgi:hypothetical protein